MEATQTIIINRIITSALKRRATDLHLSVGNNPIIRVDDKLHALSDEDIIAVDFLNNLAESLFNPAEKKELGHKKGVVAVYNYGNQVRFRVNAFYQKNFLNFSFKFIPNVSPLLKDLGLPKIFQNLASLMSGLIIIGGNHNSGRSTTVSSFLEHINKNESRYIITIEKPVEFLIQSNKSIVIQRNIPTDVNSYKDALDNCENEDVGVIMMDKLDVSADVMIKIFEAALSGKLVITMINEDSVVGIIEKILSNFAGKERERAKILFANSLECILAQKLVARIGGGRILVPEILLANSPVKASIKDDKFYQLNNILQTSREEGMRGIDISLAELVETGEISLEEALKHCNNKENFRNRM